MEIGWKEKKERDVRLKLSKKLCLKRLDEPKRTTPAETNLLLKLILPAERILHLVWLLAFTSGHYLGA